jgi:predicted ribonuclease YlaK
MAKKKYHELFSGIVCNPDQEKFRDAIMDDKNNFILVDAVSGSGKTLIAVTCAKQLVSHGHYDSCVFIVPTTSEQELGYRPGDKSDKIADYMVPLRQALMKIGEEPDKVITNNIEENLKDSNKWVIADSQSFLRGVNFEKQVVIIDEAQNFTVPQIKKIISRCHDNTKIVTIGSMSQIDIDPNASCFARLMTHMDGFEGYVKCDLPISYRGRIATHIDKL